MKRFSTLLLLFAVAALGGTTAWASHDGFKGNGLPRGHKLEFNLEVIAYDQNNCPSGDMIETNTHRIAVKADVNDTNFGDPDNHPGGTLRSDLIRDNDILLSPGEFQVLDGNACIDGVASFQLPVNLCSADLDTPCDTEDPVFQEYEVYARLVGKPGTGVDVRTCATDPLTDDGGVDDVIVCSTENYMEVRQKGQGSKPTFTNQSKALLSICLDTDGDTVCDTRLALFAEPLFEYFWNWNTQGKAHAQLFFVALPD